MNQSCMELVSKIISHCIISHNFQGCILVFEYTWFLLQINKGASNVLDLAVKEYQASGTQATVLNALQHAIEKHGSGEHDILKDVITGIILHNHMCKLIPQKDHLKCLIVSLLAKKFLK